MKPVTTDDVLDLLDGYLTSAALGSAMELGLFWLLDERPLNSAAVAKALSIPENRCHYWLHLLSNAGLLDQSPEGFAPSPTARTAIMDVYSQETWTFLAREERLQYPIIVDLARHIREAGSVWAVQGLTRPDYFAQLVESPEKARAFTRMLYEIHVPYADAIAEYLDMNGVSRLMDLGGGSGVVSMALLRRYRHLNVTVVDIPNVCAAGREIASALASENGLGERITYHAADYVQDELPSRFDMVLHCGAGPCSEEMCRKVRGALNPGGRLVLVDHFVETEGVVPRSCVYWAFESSLANPNASYTTLGEIRVRLMRAGFEALSAGTLPCGGVQRWSGDWVVVEAQTI